VAYFLGHPIDGSTRSNSSTKFELNQTLMNYSFPPNQHWLLLQWPGYLAVLRVSTAVDIVASSNPATVHSPSENATTHSLLVDKSIFR